MNGIPQLSQGPRPFLFARRSAVVAFFGKELFMNADARRFPPAAAALLVVVCAASLRGYASPAPSPQRKSVTPSAAKPAAPPATSSAAPASIEYIGLTSDGERFRYRVRVNTPKAISQVDVSVAYTDAGGQRQTQTVIWQNIVHSKRQPIENGKSYEDDSYLGPNTKDVKVQLHRVVYQDGSSWSPAG